MQCSWVGEIQWLQPLDLVTILPLMTGTRVDDAPGSITPQPAPGTPVYGAFAPGIHEEAVIAGVEGTPYATASPLTPPLVNAKRLLDLAQGSVQGGEVARAKCLDARFVVTIERRDGGRATRSLGFLWGAEPQAKMVGVHRGEGWVLLRVKVVHLRGVHDARSKHEQLFAEDPSGAHLTLALVVGLEVCLVPGDAKGAVRLLGDEQLELRVLGRIFESDIHDLVVRRCGEDVHVGFGPFEAVVVHGRLGSNHLEGGGAVHRKGGRGRQGHNHKRQYRDNRQFPHLLRTPSFSFNDTPTTETYSLSRHDALPI